MKRFTKITIMVIFTILILTTSFGCAFLDSFNSNNGDNQDNQSANSITTANAVVFNAGSTERVKMDTVDAIEKVKGSAVAIKVPSTDSIGYGSGTIINVQRADEKGQNLDDENIFYILTCHHVIESKGEIAVYLPDAEGDNFGESDYDDKYTFSGKIGGTFSGEVSLVGGDKDSDIAILRLDISGRGINSDKIVKANLAPQTDYKLAIGENVFAIGNPSGNLPGSVTVGTIAYINREVSIADIGEMTVLQLNTDIYHGSSGGALFNLYGEIIGVTNSGSDTYVGIGYAIPYVIDPINGTKDKGFLNVASQLLGSYTGQNYGYVSGRIEKFGFTAQPNAEKSSEIRVSSIVQSSQAYGSDMQVGDIIQMVQIGRYEGVSNGEDVYKYDTAISITSLDKLSKAINSMKPGDKIVMSLLRKGYSGNREVLVSFLAKQYVFCDTGK